MYKVSILVPVYGAEQYIERCSRSLFEQSYRNLEFVFVDDYSPDRSIEVLKRVIDDYPERKECVKIVRHDRNKGLAAARNTGLAHSDGDFILYVDSDDWIELDAVKLLVNKQLRRNSDLVWGQYLVYEEEEPRLLEGKEYTNKRDLVLQMMQHTWDHFLAGRLVRRSLFITNGLFWKEGLNVAEDRYMMTMLAYYSRYFDSVDQPVYHYERRNYNALTNTISAKKALRNHRQELRNVLLLEEFFRDKESVYQKECSRCVMEELERSMLSAVRCLARRDYYELSDIVNGRSDADLQLIGWEKEGLRGRIEHSFGYMVFSRMTKRIVRILRERLRSIAG